MERNFENDTLLKKLSSITSPAYVIDEKNLIYNLEILDEIQKKSGAKILLAQKAFSNYKTYPLLKKYLKGTTSSGLFEAKLAHKYWQEGENHIFSPAYTEKDFKEIVEICDHIVFNSISQYEKFAPLALEKNKICGIRINPEISTQEGHEIYDPCSEKSRLGVRLKDFKFEKLKGITGIHFHTLCQQNVEPLITTLEAIKENFGRYLPKLKWLNFGGGHHITRDDYDRDKLIEVIKDLKKDYNLEIYIEPGEAVALNAGYLVANVLEIQPENEGICNVILDVSAACHMPDVLEMPYRPRVINSHFVDEKPYKYRFAGPTCLAGDIIGEYSFDEPLQIGSQIVFCDMAIYSTVKNNTFNGMPLPDILLLDKDDKLEVLNQFSYEDFEGRL